MNVVVVGCGAIGGVVAASLTRAGLRVVPVTGNAAIATRIASDGYRVRELDGTSWTVAPSASPLVALSDEDVAGAPFDLCVLATPSTKLEAALESVKPRLTPLATVVCCQNGLPEERAARIVGRERVVGAVVGWGASMIEPGSYVRTSRGGFQLGRPWFTSDEEQARMDEIVRVLSASSPAEVATNFAGVRWSKLAINCCITTLGAIGGDALGPLLRHRFVRRLALEIFAEVSRVASNAGVRPTPVGGTLDITSIAMTDEERGRRFGSASLLYKHSLLLAVGMKYRRMRSSMLYAIERGRSPEIDHLNGELVRRGAELGVPTPVNTQLVEKIRAIVAGSAAPGLETLRSIRAPLAQN